MRFLSVCSGLGGAELAFEPLGWQCAGVSEVDEAASAVLQARWPNVKNFGDFTKIGAEDVGSIDLLVGGTPCQSFSVAGLRGGLGDDRGNLALEFLRLADRTRPRWILWENVPGVYSATSHVAPDPCPPQIDLDDPNGPKDGEEIVVEDEYDADENHAFSCFLAGLSELGYGYAYGTLDAQHFGVPQRRRRIFVIGHLGNWRCSAAVLFEFHSLSGHPPPRKEKRQSPTRCPQDGSGGSCGANGSSGDGRGLLDVAGTLGGGSGERGRQHHDGAGAFVPESVAHTLGTRNTDGRNERGDGSGNQIPTPAWPAVAMLNMQGSKGNSVAQEDGPSFTLNAMHGHDVHAVAFDTTQVTSKTNRSNPQLGDLCHTLAKGADAPAICIKGAAIGRKPEAGPQYGEVLEDGTSYTLNRSEQHAIAFEPRYFTRDNKTGNADSCSDVVPTLSADHSNGDSAPHVAVGFIHPRQLRNSQSSNQIGIKPEADISDALTGEGPGAVSFNEDNKPQAMQVRRLTPVECARLQGVPDALKSVTIVVCGESQKSRALAEIQNRRLLSIASIATGKSKPENYQNDVLFAGQDLSANGLKISELVAINAEINLVEKRIDVRILSTSSQESVSIAEKKNNAGQVRLDETSAHAIAPILTTLEPIMLDGRADVPQNSKPCMRPLNERNAVLLFGNEIEELASGAKQNTNIKVKSTMSTTSVAQQSFLNSEQNLLTSCCSVVHAIDLFIPNIIPKDCSYALNLTVIREHLDIPYKGKPLADWLKYKMLGNGFAVPVVAWIGKRIAEVEKITEKQEEFF